MKKGLLYTYNSLYKHNMYLTNEDRVVEDIMYRHLYDHIYGF